MLVRLCSILSRNSIPRFVLLLAVSPISWNHAVSDLRDRPDDLSEYVDSEQTNQQDVKLKEEEDMPDSELPSEVFDIAIQQATQACGRNNIKTVTTEFGAEGSLIALSYSCEFGASPQTAD